MTLLNTDGIVAFRRATSQRFRLDVKCSVPPGALEIPTVSLLATPAETDPGNELDERHGWRLSQHQSRLAPPMRPSLERRDLEIQEPEAGRDLSANPASLPELKGAQ
jgi:hypothetical protein